MGHKTLTPLKQKTRIVTWTIPNWIADEIIGYATQGGKSQSKWVAEKLKLILMTIESERANGEKEECQQKVDTLL